MQRVLSIFNSRFIKGIIWGLMFICMFGTVVSFLNYAFWNTDKFTRIMWNSFYNQEKVDNVYIGSSHVHCNIVPSILDKANQENNFNVSGGAQSIQESYYNLKEADRVFDIKKAYIELYYLPSTGIDGDYSYIETIKNSWRNTDYMSFFSPVRYIGIYQMSKSEHLIDALLPFVRYRSYIFDWRYISDVIDGKNDNAYVNYKFHHDYDDGNGHIDYVEKGYAPSTRKLIKEDVFTASRIPEEMIITEDAERYLMKCIDYCKQENIELTLFIAPMWATQLISTENYDGYCNSIKKIAENEKISFYDFNLCKEEYLNLENYDNFCDIGHLSSKGAELFTQFFYDVESGEYDGSDIFYNTYAEKVQNASPQLYGAYLRNSQNDNRKRTKFENNDSENPFWEKLVENFIEANEVVEEDEENIRSLSLAMSHKDEMEFRIILTRNNEDGVEYNTPEQQMIQDFSSNATINLPNGEHGICTVVWRMKNDMENVNTMEFLY